MPAAPGTNSTLYPLFSRRPAVPLVLLFISGIGLHAHLPVRPWTWLAAIAVLVAIAVVGRSRPGLATLCLSAATLLSAVALTQLHAVRFPTRDIATYATDHPRVVQVELHVDHPPRILTGAFDLRPLPPRQVFTATITAIAEHGGWTATTGQTLVQINQPHPRLRAGQRLRVTGMLQRPGAAMNPGQFDWARYYRGQRILTSLHIRSPGNIEIRSTAAAGPLAQLRRAARSALALGFTREQALDHALLQALLLGDNDPELRDVQQQFIRTGTSHHLAISGMHIAVLGGFVLGICRLLACPPRATAIIVGLFVALYGMAALPSPPVLRSVALCLFMGMGLLNRRSLDLLQLLALSALAMLIYDPLDLHGAGFQLSFITVLGLVLLTRPVAALLHPHDPALDPIPLSQRPRGQVLRERCLHRGAQILAAAGVAWAVSLPLVAYHFERLNPWAMLASIVLAPPVFAALIFGLLKVVLTLLLPSLAEPLAALCIWPVTLMRQMVDALALMPGSDVAFPRPPPVMIVLYYLVLCATLLPRRHGLSPWRFVRLAPAGLCLLVMCLPLLLGARAHPGDSRLRLTVLAIGGGSCAVLELPDRRAVLFDAGSVTLTDPVERCIAPFLRSRGINRIDALFISHANYDHFSAAVELIDRYGIRNVYLPPQFEADSADNPPAQRLLRRLAAGDCARRWLAAGESIALDGGIDLEVLWPVADSSLRLNDASLALRLRCGGRSILLPGDVQAAAQQRMLAQGIDLRADVLIAPHHGSFESTTRDFVRAVAPVAIISSNDRTLTLRQKDFERVVNVPLYRTHRHGAVTIEIVDGELTLTPFRPTHPTRNCPPTCPGPH